MNVMVQTEDKLPSCAPSHHIHPTGPSPEHEGEKMKTEQENNLLALPGRYTLLYTSDAGCAFGALAFVHCSFPPHV